MTKLFSRVKSPTYLPADQQLSSNEDRELAINRINQLRNEYDHFIPKGWSIEISGLPRLVRIFCGILTELAIQRPSLHFRIWPHRERILQLVSLIEEIIGKTEAEWRQ